MQIHLFSVINACTNNIAISQDDPEVIIGNEKFEVE